MKTVEIKTKSRGTLNVNVPSTKNDWQLYDEVPGAGRAAQALTAALVKGMRLLVRDGSVNAETILTRDFGPVADKHHATGAADGESFGVAQYYLRKFQVTLRGR